MAEVVKKALALVEDHGDAENPNGTFSVILSDATEDRDGEVIDPKAFEPLPDHLSADLDHGMSVTSTVGSGKPYYAEDGSLRLDGTYASTPLGQETRTLVKEGHIRTVSVAFITKDKVSGTKSTDGKPHIKSAELLNFAFTPVPSNRNAQVLSAKNHVGLKVGATISAANMDLLQTIHDALLKLGVDCDKSADGDAEGDDDSKDDAKSVTDSTTETTSLTPTDGTDAKSAAAEAEELDALSMRARTARIRSAAL